MSTLPKDSLVLVTGGNGLIGSHVVDQALKAGLCVRAAVRTTKKGELVKGFFEESHPGRIEYVIVPDISAENAYVEAVKGVAGVIHLASVLPAANATYDSVIPPSVGGTMSILKAALKEPRVKRVVITSSNVAAGLNRADGPLQYWDATTWNTETHEARDEKDSSLLYVMSKIKAERAAWDFVKREQPSFVLNTILPNMNFGQMFPGFSKSSGGMILAIANAKAEHIKSFPPQWFINVADSALLHVLVLLDPNIANERLFAVSGPYAWNDVVRAIRKVRPDAPIAEDYFGAEGEKLPKSKIDFERARALMGPYGGFKDLETTVREALESGRRSKL